MRGFLWRRREATAHNHNANLSPLFFSSVLPLTWLPNAPKCSRTTWRFARLHTTTREEEAATITRCSNEHSHFTSLWDYMRLLQIATSTAVIPFALLETFSFLREFSFIIAESRNAARHFRRRNELLFGKHWNWRKMHFNSLRSKASFSFNNCVSFEANKPR